MADKMPEKDTSSIETMNIVQEIEEMMRSAENQRKTAARQNYDNNFFDDGNHFRFISRITGRLVDLSEQATLYAPKRAIPKASRQIRGMANLILSNDFVPRVRPDKVNQYSFPDKATYDEIYARNKENAKRVGHWLEEQWDDQDLKIKLAQMLLLTMKNKIAYMQIWADPVEEAIRTQVYDFFDIYLASNVTEIYDSPFIIKAFPKTIREIKANENFDKKQLERINPDNRYASDEIKEAYLASKYGPEGRASDTATTLIEKEAFIKEYVNDKNMARIRSQGDGGDLLKEKKKGDPIIRHVFTAGGVWLLDEYTNLPDYPFVDLRLEPGPMYPVSQIERFMSANKSLDEITSRLERYIHTMNVGVWLKRSGEGFRPTNVAGGLIMEYDQTPPQQMALSPVPSYVFSFMEFLTSLIEEQGVTTSALAQVPKGVKAWGAIESLKASELSNLYIAVEQLKKTIQKISEKMLDIADSSFVSPHSVPRLDKHGEPDYFEVMGQKGIETRVKINEEVPPDIVPLKKDYKVDIVVESGLGYTDEGKKERMMQLAQFLIELGKMGLLGPDAVKLVVERLLEVFKFGPTGDMMEAMDQIPQAPPPQQFSPEQQMQVKTSMLEVIKDLQMAQQGGQNAGGDGTQAQGGGGIPQGMV